MKKNICAQSPVSVVQLFPGSYSIKLMADIVQPENVILWITWRMGKKSVTDFAKELGIGRQSLYDVLSGSRQPSKSMLKKLGLRVVYQIVDPEETPAKRKK